LGRWTNKGEIVYFNTIQGWNIKVESVNTNDLPAADSFEGATVAAEMILIYHSDLTKLKIINNLI
jgi:hypothetical protein